MSSYSRGDSYSNSYSGSGNNSSYNNTGNYNNAGTGYNPSSRRPDGSYRDEIRVRTGYTPDAEKQAYVPPPARTGTVSPQADAFSDDRIASWADEAAPVISDYTDSESIAETSRTEGLKEKETTVIEIESVLSKENTTQTVAVGVPATETETGYVTQEVVSPSVPSTSAEPRKPSQLATAIDTALDSFSIDGNNSIGESSIQRPIGRFAAQIASDEREGRTYRRYESGYSSSGYNNNNSGYSNSAYNRDGYNNNTGYSNSNSGGYTNTNYNRDRTYNSWNRTGTGYCNSSKEVVSNEDNNSGNSNNIVKSPSSEIRIETEFKTFLEQLTALRREMAVINAKLEYIKYFKGLGREIMTESEKERLAMGPILNARMDAIFESIDALNKQ